MSNSSRLIGSDRLMLAAHEAGHVIVASQIEQVLEICSVNLKRAETVVRLTQANSWDQAEWLSGHATIAFGGLAGELVVDEPRHLTLIDNDLLEARDAAERFLTQPSRDCLLRQWRPSLDWTPNVRDRQLVSHDNADARVFLMHSWQNARQLVNAHVPELQRLIGALLVKNELHSEDIKSLLD